MDRNSITSPVGADHVLVLGAGFSRSLSDRMPLTDELGNLCLELHGLRQHHRVPEHGFRGGTFETWLSRLADEQPYLAAEENLENQALFLRFSAAIADVLGERVHDALTLGWPEWLPEFLRVSHQCRSTLITFNYDTLIECGVATNLLDDWGAPEPVFWAENLGDVPSWPPGSLRLAATPAHSFKLLKLHGSLNWYWSPGDSTGISVARRVLPGTYNQATRYTEEDRRRELPGRVPFVVPPSATKSPYYRNPIVQEFWRQAAKSLRSAQAVTIVGYSLPPSDLTVASMLTDTLIDSTAPIRVVDINPGPIVDRLISLGLSESRVHAFSAATTSPIAEFVGSWRDEIGTEVVRKLRGLADTAAADQPMLIYWGKDRAAAVVDARRFREDGTTLELVTDSPGNVARATRPRLNDGESELPTLRDAFRGSTDRPLRIRTLSEIQTVIGHQTAQKDVGYGSGQWNVLVPSGSADPDSL